MVAGFPEVFDNWGMERQQTHKRVSSLIKNEGICE